MQETTRQQSGGNSDNSSGGMVSLTGAALSSGKLVGSGSTVSLLDKTSILKKRMDDLLKGFVDNGTIGCSCSVIQNDELMYENSFGYMNLEEKKPLELDTIFRMYSMTKVITCTAAMMLFERGLFQIQDPISEYLPEFKEMTVLTENGFSGYSEEKAKRQIRVRDLLSMTAGMPYGYPSMESGRRVTRLNEQLAKQVAAGDNVSVRDMVRGLARIPLAHEPGTQWLYGTCHDVLAALIEVVSGKSYEEFLREELVEPLAMKNTSFRFKDIDMDKLCSMYKKNSSGEWIEGSGNEAWYQTDLSPAIGGAGLLSTLHDYQSFAQMLALGGEYKGHKIIGRNTIDLMRKNQLTPKEMKSYSDGKSGTGYGLGVYTVMDRSIGGLNGSVGEFGWSGMAGTSVIIDPLEKISVVFMQQQLPNAEGMQKQRIRAAVYGALC